MNMLTRDMFGFVCIASFDRGDDAKNLFGRFGAAIAQKRCRQTHEMDLVVDAARGLDQLCVAGCFIDQFVKLPVQLRKLARGLCSERSRSCAGLIRLCRRAIVSAVARWLASRGKTLKPLAQFEQFEDLALREIRNKGAAPWPDRGEPLMVETMQRFTERSAAHSQSLAEGLFVDPRPRLQSPFENHPTDAVVERRRKGLRWRSISSTSSKTVFAGAK